MIWLIKSSKFSNCGNSVAIPLLAVSTGIFSQIWTLLYEYSWWQQWKSSIHPVTSTSSWGRLMSCIGGHIWWQDLVVLMPICQWANHLTSWSQIQDNNPQHCNWCNMSYSDFYLEHTRKIRETFLTFLVYLFWLNKLSISKCLWWRH